MKLAVAVFNTLAVAATVMFLGLGAYYGPPGSWGLFEAAVALVLLFPCIAAVVASRKRASALSSLVARWSAVAWAAFLALLGLGASTGIGGAVGLLTVIIPALLLLALNWFALRAKASTDP